jgi:hypothetical protein
MQAATRAWLCITQRPGSTPHEAPMGKLLLLVPRTCRQKTEPMRMHLAICPAQQAPASGTRNTNNRYTAAPNEAACDAQCYAPMAKSILSHSGCCRCFQGPLHPLGARITKVYPTAFAAVPMLQCQPPKAHASAKPITAEVQPQLHCPAVRSMQQQAVPLNG